MVRPPAVAGMFYPKNPEELKKQIDGFLQQAEEYPLRGKLKALIVPHAGYIYSGIVAAQGYKLLESKTFKKVLLLGPSHYQNFYGAAIGEEDFLTPLGIVKVGETSSWKKENLLVSFPEAHAAEHSLEVQLPFLQETLGEFELYALVLGTVNEEKLAKYLSAKIDQDTLVIISSDLSHYLEYGRAVLKDNDTISKILNFDPGSLDACGKAAIKVLMHLAETKGWQPQLIDYRNSGDTSGDKSRVVGYASIAYVE
ncbi:AmmeMemoRadiSam system protein B [Candidatus Woesearchaeota archaeon]|nr:AmmeMemoRadiSam system protein B [Candidatus Woesearchaeota archaeon]